MGIFVKVTEAHIREGKPCRKDFCPLALAIADALGVGCNHVRVYEDRVTIFWGRIPRKFRLSGKASEAVRRFDSGEPIEPFAFILE